MRAIGRMRTWRLHFKGGFSHCKLSFLPKFHFCEIYDVEIKIWLL